MSTRLLTTRTARRTSRQRQTQQSQTRQRQTRRAGFTVIEVLVAMFILLVGGLAILNIFPPALQVIRGSENREIAISMTQSVLERYSNQPDTIPDAVYSDNGNGVWTDAGNVAVAGTRIRNNSLPRENNETAFDASALGNLNNFGFRRIVGEKHKVLSGVGNALFVLINFSYSTPTTIAPIVSPPTFYVEEEIIGVRVQSATPANNPDNGRLDFTNARLKSDESVSLSDVQNPRQLADGNTAPELDWDNVNLRYYVSYRYLEGANIAGVEDERLVFVTPLLDNRVFQGRAATPRVIVSGEISMRVRIPITSAPTPALTVQEAAIGYLRLRTAAGTMQDALLRPVNFGDTVSVDYTVSDWRTLIFDTSATVPTSKAPAVPFPTPTPPPPTQLRDVKLPVPTLNSQPLYVMPLAQTTSGLTPQFDVIGQWSGSPAVAVSPAADVSSSSVTLSVVAGTNPQARISYQTSRGWAQQVSVAAKNYYPFDLNRPNGEREPWREYAWPTNTSTLYFRASEAGKTALVTFRYNDGSVDRLVSNQVVPISRDLFDVVTAVPIVPAGFVLPPTSKVARATLLDINGGSINATAILSVRGASIRSRTAWIENNNYVQEVKEDYRPLTD